MTTYAVEGVHRDEGSVVLMEGWRTDAPDPTVYLIAVDHRMAQAIVDALADGEPVIVQAEPWQVVGSLR